MSQHGHLYFIERNIDLESASHLWARSFFLMANENAKSVGENVVYGYGTAKGVVNAWIKSDGHRTVIENENYTDFGISVEKNNAGRNFIIQIFIVR